MTKRIKNKSKGIVSWPADERPRERLIARGSHALTDAELIAILLRVGVHGKSAIELGRELLNRFGSIQNMMQAPPSIVMLKKKVTTLNVAISVQTFSSRKMM